MNIPVNFMENLLQLIRSCLLFIVFRRFFKKPRQKRFRNAARLDRNTWYLYSCIVADKLSAKRFFLLIILDSPCRKNCKKLLRAAIFRRSANQKNLHAIDKNGKL